jgi:hypothetical protein
MAEPGTEVLLDVALTAIRDLQERVAALETLAGRCRCPCGCWSAGVDGLCDACRMNIHSDDRPRPRPVSVPGEKVADVARAFSVSRATIYRLAEGDQ